MNDCWCKTNFFQSIILKFFISTKQRGSNVNSYQNKEEFQRRQTSRAPNKGIEKVNFNIKIIVQASVHLVREEVFLAKSLWFYVFSQMAKNLVIYCWSPLCRWNFHFFSKVEWPLSSVHQSPVQLFPLCKGNILKRGHLSQSSATLQYLKHMVTRGPDFLSWLLPSRPFKDKREDKIENHNHAKFWEN